jgi:transcriptional regulator with XRE-family HTH domain
MIWKRLWSTTMTRTDIGRRIAELRRQQGLTQEELAEKARLNVRTIQRIEQGEVAPRPSTLRMLSEFFACELVVREQTQKADFWLVLVHLSSIVPLAVLPILIWAWKRDEVEEMRQHCIDVLNFQLSMIVCLFAAVMLIFVVIGLVLLPALGIFISVMAVLNAIRVAMGQEYRYPPMIRFLRKD